MNVVGKHDDLELAKIIGSYGGIPRGKAANIAMHILNVKSVPSLASAVFHLNAPMHDIQIIAEAPGALCLFEYDQTFFVVMALVGDPMDHVVGAMNVLIFVLWFQSD
jgi:hypothetical protein